MIKVRPLFNILTIIGLFVSAQAALGEVVFKMRFVEHDTRQPIVDTEFSLVPIRVISDPVPGQESVSSNLKFAKTIKTDSQGVASLSESEVADLTKGGVRVYCSPQAHSRFNLSKGKPPLSKSALRITVFKEGIVDKTIKILPGRVKDIALHIEDHDVVNKPSD